MSVYLNEYEVVTVLRDAKMCSTSERYSKNIGAQRSPIDIGQLQNFLQIKTIELVLMAGQQGQAENQPNVPPQTQSLSAILCSTIKRSLIQHFSDDIIDCLIQQNP